MNRSEFWAIIGVAVAILVLLWTIWTDVADVRQEVADVRQEVADVRQEVAEVHKDIASIHKVLADIQADIRGGLADLRTEMIRETSRNREDTIKLGARIDVLEATQEAAPQQ